MASRKIIGIGDSAVGKAPGVIVTLGLGSCVGVCLWDSRTKIGGMAHVMLPESGGRKDKPGKYGDTAVDHLLEEMKKIGLTSKSGVVAKIFGGAAMFKQSSMDVGKRNVESVKRSLRKAGIRIAAEDTGGNRARSIEFNLDTGEVMVKKVGGGEKIEIVKY